MNDHELYREADEQEIIAAARALMVADPDAALVTVDRDGQPRVRSVRAFPEEFDPGDPVKTMTCWVMTRLNTRKVEQVRSHSKVALYFDDDAQISYLTIMGEAIVHTDADNPRAKRLYDDEYAAFFWPDFPNDFVMIEIQPKWMEFMGPGVPNHGEHWRPQGLYLSPP